MILRSVSLFTSGLFGCEVSADYPEYDTDIRRRHLHVFGETDHSSFILPTVFISVSPSARPSVTGIQPHYKPGDTINITCSSQHSFPAANLSWFVNGNKVNIYPGMMTTQI